MNVREKDQWENQSLVEQVTEILRYIDTDPNQSLVPDGRVELLRRTLTRSEERALLRSMPDVQAEQQRKHERT